MPLAATRGRHVSRRDPRQLRRAREVGASVAVTVGGCSVGDLWGGHADPQRTRPWNADTLVNLFSTTKGVAALCAHRLADQRHGLDHVIPIMPTKFGLGFQIGTEAEPIGPNPRATALMNAGFAVL